MKLSIYVVVLILATSSYLCGQKKLDFSATIYLRDGTTVEGRMTAEKYVDDWVVTNNSQQFKIAVDGKKTRIDKSKTKKIKLSRTRIFDIAYGNTTALPDAAVNNDFHIGQYVTKGDFEVFKIYISGESASIYGVGTVGKTGVSAQYFWIRNGKFRRLKKPDFMESLRKIAVTNEELASFLKENDKQIRKDEQFEKILKFYAELKL